MLKGLASNIAPLTPGMSVKVTFTFANAGQATLTVPVHLELGAEHADARRQQPAAGLTRPTHGAPAARSVGPRAVPCRA